ncbi:signal peptidase [Duganella sp. BJB488]|nr:signal peptidase [Duganella sp. BJB489]RFP17046.1 signal peptidase [Duganella sp. BJB488]RFP31548.1 signal peptidase [Duganella sp. BJB480]
MFTVMAMGALISGVASAQSGQVVSGTATSGSSGAAAAASSSASIVGLNATKGCVRFYVNGQQDLTAGKAKNLGPVVLNRSYTASVFSGACGGAATKTVHFTPTNTRTSSNLMWIVKP